MSERYFQSDVLIIGSGAAGMAAALHLAEHYRVHVICKGPCLEGSSYYAQGGIAAVQAADDSHEAHVQDTLVAGAGLCDEAAVRFVVENAKAAVEWLVEQGVAFTRDEGAPEDWPYHLTREGGHSHRRIIHADDATGKSLQTTLVERAKAHPNITIFEHQVAIDLVRQDGRCVGAYIYSEADNEVNVFEAQATLLATGGASRVYLYSSNPVVSSGDGIAMAYRAGCRIANMEFNQFHPTCLYHPLAGSFLITEAMRGEGAYLRLPSGERFMPNFHPKAELAPRDIVARAIDHEMKRLGIDCVYLDISHKDADFIREHFPTIYERCLHFGIDITKESMPVVPAAHYTCGGVMVDEHGKTDLPGLYAAGEVTYTGLHGANRMASNSLLECLVYARSAVNSILQQLSNSNPIQAILPWDISQISDPEERIMVSHSWDELRRLMWNYVGIVRSNERLQRAADRIALIQKEMGDFYRRYAVNKDLLEVRNLAQVAELIVCSAQQRQESRGLHYTLDYPESSEAMLAATILQLNYHHQTE